MIDTDGWTLDDFKSAITQLNAAYAATMAAQQADTENRRAQIGQAITALQTLLGPVEGEPGVGSIRDVLRYDDQTMADNAGLAFRLAFVGLEQLTATVLNLAHIIEKS